MNSKNLILSVLLLLALVSSWWLIRNSFTTDTAENINLPNTPDSYMVQAHYTHYNQQGQLLSSVSSPHLIHYPKQDTSILDKPRLEFHAANGQTWIITADHGVSKYGVKVVYLTDNVKVERIDKQTRKTMTMTTTALTAYPPQDYAETNEPVTIVQPGSVINSVGLTANLKTGDITLLSNAQGVYESPSP